MSLQSENSGTRPCWFVGAVYNGTDDQMPRFLSEGIWENGYQDRYLDQVRAIKPGDRIAIKSSYTRKRDFPFDNRGQAVSVMAIKAIGTVTENIGDGRRVRVDWIPIETPREWLFYTHRSTIWRVLPGEWMTDALIAFAFEGQPQDIDRFRNEPYWRERYGDVTSEKQRFQWTQFYQAIAEKLLSFQNNRQALLDGIYAISNRVEGLTYLLEKNADGTTGHLDDICPFTTLGIFNRGTTDANRVKIASELAAFLDVTVSIPESFEGIPVLNNQNSWFFSSKSDRKPDDINALWQVFSAAIRFAESDEAQTRLDFMSAFDDAIGRRNVGWNLTCGLYWIRPWDFLSLDIRSQQYITKKLNMKIGHHGPKNRCNADDYLAVMDSLETRFQEDDYSVHSFPDLSLAAWLYTGTTEAINPGEENDDTPETDPGEVIAEIPPVPHETYSLDNILSDGCFLERVTLAKLLERLRTKKNLILQGPPGTGKTWLAKRLAFTLMGQRDETKVRAIQFHPNLSYEDFVRGWRPTGEGKLSLVDGPFMETIIDALHNPSSRYVVVIEEINRGNPAQIFGEMLTLLEADKRTPTEALELCYRRDEDERVFIPNNLYVIGTMNIADRSLALVDLALRRRFAFCNLEPTFGAVWRDWVTTQNGVDSEILRDIEQRMLALNDEIAADPSLGRQFRIGHSYVTPPRGQQITDAREWFRDVVETEIGPLLGEYWFDAPDKVRSAQQRLIEGF